MRWRALAAAAVVACEARGLGVGDPAPDFKARSSGGADVTLSGLRGKWVVLFFYPKAFTPGCTKEVCSLRDGHEALASLNAVVLGVSLDKAEQQRKFREEYRLPFELLDDSDRKVSRAYGVLSAVGLFAQRRTFLISPEGKVTGVIADVEVGRHAEQVAEALRALQVAAPPRAAPPPAPPAPGS